MDLQALLIMLFAPMGFVLLFAGNRFRQKYYFSLPIICASFLFFSTFASFIFFLLTFRSNLIFHLNIKLKYGLPQIIFYVDKTSTLLILSSLLGFLFFVFFANKNIFARHFRATLTPVLILCLFSCCRNIVANASLFSVAGIFVTYLFLKGEQKESSIEEITSDFVWHRVSDLFLITACTIFFALKQQFNFSIAANLIFQNNFVLFLLFASCFCRVVSLKSHERILPNDLVQIINNKMLSHFLLTMALIFFFQNFFGHFVIAPSVFYFLLAIASIMTIHATALLFFAKIKSRIETFLAYTFSSVSLLFTLVLQSHLIIFPLMTLLIAYPLIIILIQEKKRAISVINEPQGADFIISPMENTFSKTYRSPIRFLNFLAHVASGYLSPFYANFLLYRLPQGIFFLAQFPIRIFHNGNVQRALLFAVFLATAYHSIWSK